MMRCVRKSRLSESLETERERRADEGHIMLNIEHIQNIVQTNIRYPDFEFRL
jgi:hypothetical protein